MSTPENWELAPELVGTLPMSPIALDAPHLLISEPRQLSQYIAALRQVVNGRYQIKAEDKQVLLFVARSVTATERAALDAILQQEMTYAVVPLAFYSIQVGGIYLVDWNFFDVEVPLGTQQTLYAAQLTYDGSAQVVGYVDGVERVLRRAVSQEQEVATLMIDGVVTGTVRVQLYFRSVQYFRVRSVQLVAQEWFVQGA